MIFLNLLRAAGAAKGAAVNCAEILVPIDAGKPPNPESSHPFSPGTTSSRLQKQRVRDFARFLEPSGAFWQKDRDFARFL